MINHLLGEIYISDNLLKIISTTKDSLGPDFAPILTDVLHNLVTSYVHQGFDRWQEDATPEEIRQYIEDNSEQIERHLALWTAQQMNFVVSGSETLSQVTALIGLPNYVADRDLENLFKLYKKNRK